MVKILVLPEDPNPYQRLLYAEMPSDIHIAFPGSSRWLFITHPFVLLFHRLRGTRVLHVHWTFFLTLPVRSRGAWWRVAGEANHWLFLAVLRLLRYRLVWTAHNAVPHSRQTLDDTKWSRRLGRAASAVIVHSQSNVGDLAALGIATDMVEVIPHGHYRDIYPSRIAGDAARRQLGISPNVVVALFFGTIKPYKGVVRLLEAFPDDDRAHLVVAGNCDDPDLFATITSMAAGRANISVFAEFIADEQVSMYFAVADFVCLPFTSITTSGSALLAIGFGLPVVGPRIGGLADLPASTGWYYDPSDAAGLSDALDGMISDPERVRQLGHAASAYADTLDWASIAAHTARVFRDVAAA